MTREEACSQLQDALAGFAFEGEVVSCRPYGSGHINDTFLVDCENAAGRKLRYILQRMNHEIFLKPVELMENVQNVTSYLRRAILARGGDPERETLNVVPTHAGANLYRDKIGCWWRSYRFIEDAVCLDAVKDPSEFYASAVAFGNFQRLLADFPASTLHETILNFHNTPVRFAALERAAAADACGRASRVQPELEFAMARREEAATLTSLLDAGKLPLRVTHNDTKLNNVMLDAKTGKGLCVIDLDTVMPGLSVHDFGDSIRFGASTAAEDERDLSRVTMSLKLFELYTRGFLSGCGGSLTSLEIEMLPMGAKLMTLECGIRFLTDYLEGDAYFRTHREGHNLDRCRTQLKLVEDMEHKWGQMASVVSACAAEAGR